nr:hypothetical protein [Tanacetum cinerariifolium]GEZ07784.1 hypothetical protein [Tanacetum cinerariifolium]
MEAPIISISSDVSTAVAASLVRVLELDTHSSLEADPLESSPPPVSIAPMVSPFLCLDDSESDTKIPERHVSPTTSTPKIPTAPILSTPSAIVAPPFEEDLPVDRLYRTHPGGPCKALIVRNLVRPLPSHRLALRTPWCSKAYLCWRSTSLSTMYPPTTSESSAGDSSSESSVGPSFPSRDDILPPHKRFKDSILPEDSVKEDIDTNMLEDIEADITTVEVAIDRDVEARIDVGIGIEVDVRIDVEVEVEDEVESSDRGTMEVRVDIDAGIDIPNGMLMPDAVECLEQDFMKCQPLNFKGTKRVVGLTRWFEKMEIVFYIRNCPKKYQVKYTTSTLLNSSVTWWNSHKRTVRTNTAFAISWRELMKLMAEVYYPRNEVQKMESKLWNLTVKNNDLAAYTQRFQELTMLCTRMVLEEEDQIERYVGGLPDNSQGNVMSVEPTRLQDAIRSANSLMGQKLKGYAMKNAKNKRRSEVNQRDNRGQQPLFKRPNFGGHPIARAYTACNNKRRPYNETFPLCNKCKFHYEWPCTVRCKKCNK